MLVALPKQAEKKLIAVVFVAHLPHPTPPTLHDPPCPSGDLQQKLSEFDQFQSFTGAGMSVVKLFHPLLREGISGQNTPRSYYIHVVSPCQEGPQSRLTTCAWQRRAPCIHEEALRSHEKALSEFNINISAAFFKFCVKTPVIDSASRGFAAPAAPHIGHQGAPVPFRWPLERLDRETKIGI